MMPGVAISGGAAPHPVLDFAGLVEEGRDLLTRMTDGAWTDFNAHDPGVTILEAACYALVDLGYRLHHPIAELVAGDAPPRSAAERLASAAVTAADVRRLALDVDGVRDVQIMPGTAALLASDGGAAVNGATLGDGGDAVAIAGLSRILIAKSAKRDRTSAVVAGDVALRLSAQRGLGEDWEDVVVLEAQRVAITASLDVAEGVDGEAVLADGLTLLDLHLSPRIVRQPQDGASSDIADGPPLRLGAIADDALAAGRRQTIYRSDIAALLTRIPGVIAVRNVRLGGENEWSLQVPPGAAAVLDAAGSSIEIVAGGVRIVDAGGITRAIARAAAQAGDRTTAMPAPQAAPQPGRRHDLAAYRPIRADLPPIYAVGDGTVPATATRAERARSNQLRGYLALFDQVVADGLGQLAATADLVAPGWTGPAHAYAAQPVPDLGAPDPVGSSLDAAALAGLIAQSAGPAADSRRARLLAYLLARVGETGPVAAPPPGSDAGWLVAARERLLADLPTLALGQGRGVDLLGDIAATPPLVRRIVRKLGLPDGAAKHLLLIEHILLRPRPGDAVQTEPLLTAAARPDPFSLSITLLAAPALGVPPDVLSRVLREEAPAHLLAFAGQPEPGDFAAVAAAYGALLQAKAAALRIAIGVERDDAGVWERRLRAARDGVIDLLQLGMTAPLQDLPVMADPPLVPFGGDARLVVRESQPDVVYQLRDQNGMPLPDHRSIDAAGTGGDLVLSAPRAAADARYVVWATKNGRAVPLHASAEIKVGLDRTLPAELVGTDERPAIGHGATATIRLPRWQEAVSYTLVQHPRGGPDDPTSLAQAAAKDVPMSKPVRGRTGDLLLTSIPLTADTVLRVRCVKSFSAAEKRPDETVLLDMPVWVPVDVDRSRRAAATPPVALPGTTVSLAVADAEADVRYRFVARPLADEDLRFGDPSEDLIRVALPDGEVAVHVPDPPNDALAVPDGFTTLGEVEAGTDGAARLVIDPPADDAFVMVAAIKPHETFLTAGWLRPVVILVTPDARRLSRLTFALNDGRAQSVTLRDGEPGTLYVLRPATGGPPVARLYAHRAGRGIGALGVERDLVVSSANPARPVVDLPSLALPAQFMLEEIRLRTGVSADLGGFQLAPINPLTVTPAKIGAGGSTRVGLLLAEGETAVLLRNDVPVGAPVSGTGATATLDSGPLNAGDVLAVRVTDAGAPVMERVGVVPVTVG